MAKMDKNTPKIAAVLVDPMIHGTNMGLVEKTQHMLFQLPAALAGDDLDQRDTLVDRLFHNPVQLIVNLAPPIIDIVQV